MFLTRGDAIKLHPYQEASVEALLPVLKSNRAALDGSEMGLGKTLCAVEVMRRVGNPATVVVCPKICIPSWHRHAAALDTELDACNWEMLRTGRTPYGDWADDDIRGGRFVWNSNIKFLIFDECHKFITPDSLNSRMGRAARRQRIPSLSLSATPADDPLELDTLGYILRLHDSDDAPTLRNPEPTTFFRWALANGCEDRPGEGLLFNGTPEQKLAAMRGIHAQLYPHKGVRVRTEDVPNFPETQITAELFDLNDNGRIDQLYAEMADAVAALRDRARSDYWKDSTTKLLRARQEIELLKVPVFKELSEEGKAKGLSIIHFLNFRASVDQLAERLQTDCIIDGRQVGAAGALQREQHRARFHTDQVRDIICNSEAGGVGIDLDDVRGVYPRLSLISPGYNAKSFKQLTGRPRRATSKSKSFQRVILAAGTVEESVFQTLSAKLARGEALQDGDFFPQSLKVSY